MKRIFAVIFLLATHLLANAAASAQTQPQTHDADPSPVADFLVLVQRSQPGENLCALIQRDGKYHFERALQDKSVEVAEGVLDAGTLDMLASAAVDPDLKALTQQQIGKRLYLERVDYVVLNLMRPGGIQNLVFDDPKVRNRYPAVTRFLEVLAELKKERKKARIADAKPTRCMPQGTTSTAGGRDERKAARASGLSDAKAKYVMAMRTVRAGDGIEDECLLLTLGGTFLIERSAQRIGGQPRMQVFEGAIAADRIAALRGLLDAESLRQLHQEPVLDLPFREGEIVTILVPRTDGLQQFTLADYFGIPSTFGDDRDSPHRATYHVTSKTDELQKLKPLREWVKQNVYPAAKRASHDKPSRGCLEMGLELRRN